MFIDNLAEVYLQKKLGVEFNGGTLSTLLYADDIVLVAQCEKRLIDTVASWCARWEMGLNLNKTKVIHLSALSSCSR